MAQTINLSSVSLKMATLTSMNALVKFNLIQAREVYYLSDIQSLAVGVSSNNFKVIARDDSSEPISEDEVVIATGSGLFQKSGFKIDDDAIDNLTSILWSAHKVSTFLNDSTTDLTYDLGRLLPAVQDILALKAIGDMEDKDLILVEDKGLYRYDYDLFGEDDGEFVIAPDSVRGYWVKIASNTSKHSQLQGVQGGEYHLTASQLTSVTRIANSTQDGLISAEDWNTFNNKLGTDDFADMGGVV